MRSVLDAISETCIFPCLAGQYLAGDIGRPMTKFNKPDYERYLNSRRWKEKRQEILKRDGSCKSCGTTKNLQVHHLSYENLGDEPPDDLVTLCGGCHKKHHEIKQNRKLKRTRGGYVSYMVNKETLQKKGTEAAIEELNWLALADGRLSPRYYRKKKKA